MADKKNENKQPTEYRSLNIRLDSGVYDEFEAFCSKYGMSKTGATEVAIRRYMEFMNSPQK